MKKLTRRFTAALLLLLVALCGTSMAAGRKSSKGSRGAIPPARSPEVAGARRYQLLSVEYSSNDLINEAVASKKDLVLLDTSTGQMQVCSQKVWTNIAVGKDVSERKCLPFDTYAEYPAGSLKVKKARETESPRP